MLVPPGCGCELWIVAVHGLPVVHRVDEDLAGEQIAGKLAEAVRGDGEDDDVGVAYDLVGRRRVRAGASTSTVSAMSSAGPDPEIATS